MLAVRTQDSLLLASNRSGKPTWHHVILSWSLMHETFHMSTWHTTSAECSEESSTFAEGWKTRYRRDLQVPLVPMRRVLVLEGASGAATATIWPACSLGPVLCFLKARAFGLSSKLQQVLWADFSRVAFPYLSKICSQLRYAPSQFRCGPFKLLRETEHPGCF